MHTALGAARSRASGSARALCVCPSDLDQALAWLAWPSGSTSRYLAPTGKAGQGGALDHPYRRCGGIWTGAAAWRRVSTRATSQGAPGRGYQVVSTEGNRVGKAPQYTFHVEGVPSAVCGAFRRELDRGAGWLLPSSPPLQMVTHGRGPPTRREASGGRARGREE